jgi:hypothetical protein
MLPASGLIAKRSDWTNDARYVFFNVSPNAGHHHPDTLSIQFWADGRHLLIDPGCGFYGTRGHGLSKQRWWHNCPSFGPHNTRKKNPKILFFETTENLDNAVGQLWLGDAVARRHLSLASRDMKMARQSWNSWCEEDLTS